MIEAVVKARDARELSAHRQRAHVARDAIARAFARETQHWQRKIDTDRSEAALCEEVDCQSRSARDIQMRFLLRGKTLEVFREDAPHCAKEPLAERLVIRVCKGAVGLVQ